MEIFQQAGSFCGSAPVIAAKSLLALSLAKLLNVLQLQLDQYRRQIEALFAQHPDHDLLGSLPGVALILAPRLLGEIGGPSQRRGDTQALQCHGGTAPVSFQSG